MPSLPPSRWGDHTCKMVGHMRLLYHTLVNTKQTKAWRSVFCMSEFMVQVVTPPIIIFRTPQQIGPHPSIPWTSVYFFHHWDLLSVTPTRDFLFFIINQILNYPRLYISCAKRLLREYFPPSIIIVVRLNSWS